MKYLLELGASPHKLVLGVQFAGRTFTLADRNLHEVGSPSDDWSYLSRYNEVSWV